MTTEYVCHYLPYNTSAETLQRTYRQDDFATYADEDLIVDTILDETYEIGDPLEITTIEKRHGLRLPGRRLWVNTGWGID